MKKLSSLLLLVVLVFFASCSSCSNDKAQQPGRTIDPFDVPTEFEEKMTGADTSQVKEIVEVFIDHMKNKEYYDAAAMVYRHEMVNGVQRPRELNNEEIERLVTVYKMLPIEDYKIEYIRFREANLNEVCVAATLATPKGSPSVPPTKLFFNPIYIQSKWFLVLDDSHQGTDAFVPAHKRDSMRNVYKRSAQYNGGK